MNKRGQLTIFIILAILIVAVVAMYFVFRGNQSEGESSGDVDAEEVFNYVQECMNDLAEQTLYDIGKGGGYSPFEDSLTWWNYTSSLNSYYLIEGFDYMPSKAHVEKEISEHFNKNFYVCKKELSKFGDYEIEDWGIESEVRILEGGVKFNINYPLTIIHGDSYVRMVEFNFEVPSRLNLVYDFVKVFIMNQKKDVRAFCLNCVPNELEEENIFVEAIENEEGTRITFIDNSQELNGEAFKWVFVNKY